MKKLLPLLALAFLSTAAHADGPPAGGKLVVKYDTKVGMGVSYTGGNAVTVTEKSYTQGTVAGKTTITPLQLTVSAGAPDSSNRRR